ncbi:hypothetical protein ABMA57_11870 [Saccharospirillum sp. HFRX-1]|uniref:hypothetical protein n=1 Tax=unclassified Saccharospirillum TaxID=2633430 RepID=UPI0037113374
MNNIIKLLILLVITGLVSGCVRTATIEIYNNSGVALDYNFGGTTGVILYKDSAVLDYTSNGYEIYSDIGTWIYPRDIPHSGENGDYFDGNLKVQIESDGRVFALKIDDKPPVSIIEYDQPSGYPLVPENN